MLFPACLFSLRWQASTLWTSYCRPASDWKLLCSCWRACSSRGTSSSTCASCSAATTVAPSGVRGAPWLSITTPPATSSACLQSLPVHPRLLLACYTKAASEMPLMLPHALSCARKTSVPNPSGVQTSHEAMPHATAAPRQEANKWWAAQALGPHGQ